MRAPDGLPDTVRDALCRAGAAFTAGGVKRKG